MRKRLGVIAVTITILYILTSCSKPQNNTEVYSFSGEDENISINNGLIIVTNDSEKFIGGNLVFKNEKPSDIKEYFEKFFFRKNGNEETILSNGASIEGTIEGQHISSELGSTSSEDLFHGDDLDLIKKSLNFSLSGRLMNGEKFEYGLVLDVKKVY